MDTAATGSSPPQPAATCADCRELRRQHRLVALDVPPERVEEAVLGLAVALVEAAGELDILVGTHALIYEGVEFSRLGVAVVDHRVAVYAGQGDADTFTVRGDRKLPLPNIAEVSLQGVLDSEFRIVNSAYSFACTITGGQT